MADRYNTRNPRPSNSMKDLNDNALAYDDFINSDSDEAYDRFLKPFPTVRNQVAARINEIIGAQHNAEKYADDSKMYSEIAQSGSNAYPNAAAAQAAIDEGTETRQYFPVWGLVGGDIWTERYENINGTAKPTGDILATRISFLELINSIYNFQEQSAKSLANTAMFKGSGVYPLLADKDNNIALGYDDKKGTVVGVDVQSEAVLKAKLSGVGMSLYRGAGDIVPIIGGNNNGIALGYDTKKMNWLACSLKVPH